MMSLAFSSLFSFSLFIFRLECCTELDGVEALGALLALYSIFAF